jgi:hypothetical protein
MAEPAKPQPSKDKASLRYGLDKHRLVGSAQHYSGHEAPAEEEKEARAPTPRKPPER